MYFKATVGSPVVSGHVDTEPYLSTSSHPLVSMEILSSIHNSVDIKTPG